MNTPIEFTLNLPDYNTTLPDFCNAYICACISQLCYKGSVEAKHTNDIYKNNVRLKLEKWGWSPEDAKRTVVINSREITNPNGSCRPGTQALIVFYKKIAIIGFRGSEKKFNDWFTNINLDKVNSPYAEGKVHSGFLSAFNAVLPSGEAKPLLEQVISDLRDAEAIWLTGHSLGGALASIAASYLLQPEINIPASRIYVYTFGAPRVGNDSYRKDMNRRLQHRYWRFVHKRDLVADVPLPQIFKLLRLPLFVSGFAREGSVYKLDDTGGEVLRRVYQDGTYKIIYNFTGIRAGDHKLQFYRNCLLKLCRQNNPNCLEMTFENLTPGSETTNEDITPGSETTDEDIRAIEKSVRF